MTKLYGAVYGGIFRYGNALLRPHHLRLIQLMLPNGEVHGNEYVALNPTRIDRKLGSFRFNVVSGVWADFSSGDRGGDIVSIYAYITQKKQLEALADLLRMIGI